jgi:succinate-acetate transporter protein
VLDLSGAGSTIGVCLLRWGVFTFGLWISTFRLSRLLFLVFLTLWIAFFCLGGSSVLGIPALHTAGGWVGLLCGALAMYGSFALVANATYGREVAPVG